MPRKRRRRPKNRAKRSRGLGRRWIKWVCFPHDWWDGGLKVRILIQESFPAPSPILEILIKHNALGAPMEVHPLEDPNHSKNKDQPWFTTNNMKTLNNTDDFNYNPSDQTKCPYASHMRKTGPRDDYPGYNKHVMIRRGIPYGEWCSDEERASGTTQHERGLLFVSYQSSIENGFVTQQKRKCFSRISKDIAFSDTLQGGPILPMAQRTWPSTMEESARELTLLLVKFIQAGTGSLQVIKSMPSTNSLLKSPSLTRILRNLLPRSTIKNLTWTGSLFRMVGNTSLLPRLRH